MSLQTIQADIEGTTGPARSIHGGLFPMRVLPGQPERDRPVMDPDGHPAGQRLDQIDADAFTRPTAPG